MRRSLILIGFLLSCPMAHATDWVIFPTNATQGAQVWKGTKPSSSQVPAGVIDQWVIVNGDSNLADYSDGGNGLTAYTPPPPPPPPAAPPAPTGPNVAGFIQSLRTDSNLNAADRMNLVQFLGLVQMDATNPTAMHQDWNDAISTYNSTWLTPQIQSLILNYASANDIPLTGD